MPYERSRISRRKSQDVGSLARLRGSKRRMIDAHLHVVDFVQETPGGPALIDHMDRANVDKAVIFGLPVRKLWNEYDREPPDYYLANDAHCYYYAYTDVIVAEMVRALPAEHQSRLYPLICGFNPVDRYAIRHVERLYAQYPDVWSGIGEMLLRHDDLTAFTFGENARANHRALYPIYEFAGHYDLPVLLHQNVTAVSKGDHPDLSLRTRRGAARVSAHAFRLRALRHVAARERALLLSDGRAAARPISKRLRRLFMGDLRRRHLPEWRAGRKLAGAHRTS